MDIKMRLKLATPQTTLLAEYQRLRQKGNLSEGEIMVSMARFAEANVYAAYEALVAAHPTMTLAQIIPATNWFAVMDIGQGLTITLPLVCWAVFVEVLDGKPHQWVEGMTADENSVVVIGRAENGFKEYRYLP